MKTNVKDWISEFNKLVESIVIDKFKYGSKVEYMVLVIYKGNRFHKKFFFISKYIRRSRMYMHTSHKRAIIEDTPLKTMYSTNSNGILNIIMKNSIS